MKQFVPINGREVINLKFVRSVSIADDGTGKDFLIHTTWDEDWTDAWVRIVYDTTIWPIWSEIFEAAYAPAKELLDDPE